MLTLLASVALAQSLPAPQVARHWEQYETEHYRVYYPLEAEDWAKVVAENLEPIRARVQAEVGTPMPERQVEILVQDPFSRPNGFALPFQNAPRMGIFASPPNSDSILGNYRSWHELLVVHEDAHLVHLLTPSRNPFFAAIQRQLLPMGPVARKSPRWVSEGYATVVEGRLTGSGRPNGDGRATLLRAMALDGRMPAYENLNGAEGFMGGSMAYLVGSHYLEWLEAGRHPGALQELWRAMSAVEYRSFEEAFVMVFGEDPAVLYKRYLAELSHQALTIEASRPTQDTLWQDLPGYTGAPAVSPDGSQIAVVLQDIDDDPRLVIWSTDENTQAEESYQEALKERLEKDPLDVTPLRTKPLSREPVHERVHLGRPPEGPRWLPDGSGLVFTSWQTDSDGRQRPDLFLWTPEEGERRITQGAALRDADVGPTGDYAVAVRELWAVSEIVRVDLATGQTITIRPGTAMTVFDSPRLSADGTKLAYLRHQGAGWELMVYDMQTRQEQRIALPEGAQISSPEWADSETLVASMGMHGFVEAWAIPLQGSPRRLTQTRGGALHPSPAPNGDLFFLSLSAEGLSLHHAEDAVPLTVWGLARMEPERPIQDAPLLQRPPAPAAPPAPEKQPVTPSPYLLGPHDLRPVVGASTLPGRDFVELGLRAGDPAGRSTVQALIGLQAVSGASLSWTLRILPVDLGLWAWTLPGDSGTGSQGLALVAQDRLYWASGSVQGGASLRADSAGNAAAAWGQVSHRQWLSQAWVQGDASAQGQVQGEGGGQAQGTLSAGWGGTGLRAGVGRAAGPSILVGGLASSLYTPGWDSWRLYDPAFAAGISADQVSSWEAGIGAPSGGLWLSTRWHELQGPQEDTLGSLALSVDVQSPPQPFFRLGQSHIQVGVACILDPAGALPKEQLCRTKEDYSAWASITWSP